MKKRLAIVLSVLLLLSLMPASVAALTGEPNEITVGPEGDYTTIQAAINAAVAGDTITVAAGTYAEAGQIAISKDLTITGVDKETAIIKPAQDTGVSGDARGWFFVQPGVEFHLSDVTLDGEGRNIYQAIRSKGSGSLLSTVIKNIAYPTYWGWGIAVMGGQMTVSDNEFHNIGRIGVQVYGPDASGSVISHNLYIGKGDGDYVDNGIEVGGGAGDVEITGNEISHCGVSTTEWGSAGILVSESYGTPTSANITGNILRDNEMGITIGYSDDNSFAVVTGNTFINNEWDINSDSINTNLDLAAMIDTNTFDNHIYFANRPVEYHEDSDSIKSGYSSIQAAIDASEDGDTIAIKAGTYNESIVVPEASVKNITILGANSDIVPSSSVADGTIITGGMTFGRDTSSNPTIEKNVTVKGITFSGGSGLSFKDIRNVTVENNKFIGITTGDGAITVLDPSNHDRDGVTTIKNNHIDGVAGTGLGLGIYVRRPAPATVIQNNHVENTDFNSIQLVGVSAGPDVTIDGNTLINWDQNRDADGGRAMQINFDPVDDGTILTVTGNTFEPNDNLTPVDPDYVKITGLVDYDVENLIDNLIWQNTWPNGTNYSIVILVNDTAGSDFELPYSDGSDTITIDQGESVTLTVADDGQEETNVVVPATLLQYLEENQMDLEIKTPFGNISLPAEVLAGLDSDIDLEFTIRPNTDTAVLDALLKDLMSNADFSDELEGKETAVVGLPLIITSNISGVDVTLTIPLTDYDAAVTYYVYIEHSDGEKVLMSGTIVDFGDGKGIQITVNKFSTFMVLAAEDEATEETTETSATEETSETSATEAITETSATEESTDPSDEDEEPLPKTGESAPVIPYLVIALLGLALAISLRIRLANKNKVNQ